MSFTLVKGDEPFLIDNFLKSVKRGVANPEMNIINVSTYNDLISNMDTPPFFADKKVIISKVPISDLNTDEFMEQIKKCYEDVDVYFIPEIIDSRLKIYKYFQRNNNIKSFDKLTSKTQILGYLSKVLTSRNKTMSDEAMNEFIERTCYLKDIGNMYSVFSEFNKLMSLDKSNISTEDVAFFIEKNEALNVFSLINLINNANCNELIKQCDLIINSKSEGTIKVLSLLLGEYRTIYKNALLINDKAALTKLGNRRTSSKISAETASKCMTTITESINSIKQGRFDENLALRYSLLKIYSLVNQE